MLRAPLPNLTPGDRVLTGPLFHYLARVLRLRDGDLFLAFNPQTARVADAKVTFVDRSSMKVALGAPPRGQSAARREVIWVRGWPRARSATPSCATRPSSG